MDFSPSRNSVLQFFVENQVVSDLQTVFFGPTVCVNSPSNKKRGFLCVVFDDPRASLHLSLQQSAGNQLYLWGVAAVDGTQGVGSQVGQQEFRAAVQQVEHVLR